MSALVLALIVVAGLAVGATSIGGILVVPVLTTLAGLPVAQAVPASTFGFLFTGIAAMVWLRRRQAREAAGIDAAAGNGAGVLAADRTRPRAPGAALTGPQPMALYGWALLGAALGALTLQWLPSTAAQLGVAALAIVSGCQTLLARKARAEGAMPAALHGRAAVAALGLVVGCGSAWSGTGGPVILLPLLMCVGAPTRLSIAWAQGIQLPIALSATAVNLATGQLDLRLGLVLGALLVLGWVAGTAIAARMPTRVLKVGVAVALIAVGLAYCLRSVLTA
ncbi:hypothetical protein GCM10007242_22840 [Pigmentiphaga litoralis]|uniref:sulfite exporter TauE/SafE family protein n=1 Tax=Pigmentiphaga litoralis TaxID=516702 RepID=UPI001674439C|nr:sulfite exporter TauE/SafE family protein [Pigmentiphaga litoralis]GGX15701.1 hypothetical protein GCM10007242_22840 [Pigmentiphaga litoralis]